MFRRVVHRSRPITSQIRQNGTPSATSSANRSLSCSDSLGTHHPPDRTGPDQSRCCVDRLRPRGIGDIRTRRTAPARAKLAVWRERRKGKCSGCSPRAAADRRRRERHRRRVGRRTRLGAAREGDRRRGRRSRLAGLRSPPPAVQRPLPRPAAEGGRALRRSRGRRGDTRVPRRPRPRARHPQRRPLLRRAFLDQRGCRRRISHARRVDRR
jgi:hypothetical protein